MRPGLALLELPCVLAHLPQQQRQQQQQLSCNTSYRASRKTWTEDRAIFVSRKPSFVPLRRLLDGRGSVEGLILEQLAHQVLCLLRPPFADALHLTSTHRAAVSVGLQDHRISFCTARRCMSQRMQYAPHPSSVHCRPCKVIEDIVSLANSLGNLACGPSLQKILDDPNPWLSITGLRVIFAGEGRLSRKQHLSQRGRITIT